jgi:DNA-damage-inducible protein J
MDDDLKAQGNAVLEAIGLSAADAVRLFYKRVVAEQAIPLELKVPNAKTRAAMEESRKIMAARRARFAKADELIANLEAPRSK